VFGDGVRGLGLGDVLGGRPGDGLGDRAGRLFPLERPEGVYTETRGNQHGRRRGERDVTKQPASAPRRHGVGRLRVTQTYAAEGRRECLCIGAIRPAVGAALKMRLEFGLFAFGGGAGKRLLDEHAGAAALHRKVVDCGRRAVLTVADRLVTHRHILQWF
jgi:hypothetical protein